MVLGSVRKLVNMSLRADQKGEFLMVSVSSYCLSVLSQWQKENQNSSIQLLFISFFENNHWSYITVYSKTLQHFIPLISKIIYYFIVFGLYMLFSHFAPWIFKTEQSSFPSVTFSNFCNTLIIKVHFLLEKDTVGICPPSWNNYD